MAGGGGGTTWVKILGLGLALLTLAHGLVIAEVELGFGHPALLAVGGLMVVFGSCEAMILCVEGIAQRMRWNPFVAGTMAGLAANVPEDCIMLGFVLAAKPRLGFIVVAMTLHVGAWPSASTAASCRVTPRATRGSPSRWSSCPRTSSRARVAPTWPPG